MDNNKVGMETGEGGREDRKHLNNNKNQKYLNKKIDLKKGICSSLFTASLFTMAKIWKQRK